MGAHTDMEPQDLTLLLPESLRALLAAGVSEESIRLIVAKVGGVRISVPTKAPKNSSELEEAIGPVALGELSKAVGGMCLYIPRCHAYMRAKRNRAIREEYDKGASMLTLRLRYGVTEPNIRRILGGG